MTLFREGTRTACKSAMVAFALIFCFGIFKGSSVAGSCFRGAAVGAAIFISIKIVSHFFIHALIDELSGYVIKEKKAGK
ncbi:MAG: hypothetical protein ABIK28_09370 [Planctomycetota bacterium]